MKIAGKRKFWQIFTRISIISIILLTFYSKSLYLCSKCGETYKSRGLFFLPFLSRMSYNKIIKTPVGNFLKSNGQCHPKNGFTFFTFSSKNKDQKYFGGPLFILFIPLEGHGRGIYHDPFRVKKNKYSEDFLNIYAKKHHDLKSQLKFYLEHGRVKNSPNTNFIEQMNKEYSKYSSSLPKSNNKQVSKTSINLQNIEYIEYYTVFFLIFTLITISVIINKLKKAYYLKHKDNK